MIWKKRVKGFADPEITVVGGFHGFLGPDFQFCFGQQL